MYTEEYTMKVQGTSLSIQISCYFSKQYFLFNPLHPNISMHILHTVLYTFPKVLTRRICLTIKSYLKALMFDVGVILLGDIGCLNRL